MGVNFKPHFELNVKGFKIIRTTHMEYRLVDMNRDPPKDLGVFCSLEECKRIIHIEEKKAPKPKPIQYFEPFEYNGYNVTVENSRYNVWKDEELIGMFFAKQDVMDYLNKKKG